VSIVEFEIGDQRFRIDSQKGFDLSIPLRFQGERLSAFGASRPEAETYQNQGFVGNTSKGGSCNVQRYTLVPHCHGTHTECIGHLVDEPVSIADVVKDFWIPATLLSIPTEPGSRCSDRYIPKTEAQDALISKTGFAAAIRAYPADHFHQALIVRTLPNHVSKCTRRYTNAAYFSNDAMQEIVRHPVQHLLVDLPSLDRLEDQGRLSNHRIFWQIQDGAHTLNQQRPSTRTITELIYVPNEIDDGYYVLNLQIAPFMADAAPSRPIIFAVEPNEFRE
jgi:arylformamidase